jgi:DNA-3-methyladenine glycosylase I
MRSTKINIHQKMRCPWAQEDKPLYVAYHDQEWGVPAHDDIKLYEMLILEGAQAGLSWYTILMRRENYRAAFKNFDPTKVASMTDKALEALLLNEGIIRNRRKVFSARQNAQVFIKIQEEFGSFNKYVWSFVNKKPIDNVPTEMSQIPTESLESKALSKDLKKRGMNFVGPTIIYAYMQAVGLINDHLKCCDFARRN